jgi:hypothetical protein
MRFAHVPILFAALVAPAIALAQGSTAGGKGRHGISTVSTAGARPRPPVTRFSPVHSCMTAAAYGCPLYGKYGQAQKRAGWAVNTSFEPWHYRRPAGPAQHDAQNWVSFPGTRGGKSGVYLITLNGANFCPLERAREFIGPVSYRCRALVMDPPLDPIPSGAARGITILFTTEHYGEKDSFGRTELSSFGLEWDSASTPARAVNASSRPLFYWQEDRAWDEEARQAYGDAVAACMRNISVAFKERYDWGQAEYEKLRRFYRRGLMPRSIWRADLHRERRQWIGEHLETYKAAASGGDPEAIEDYDFARYQLDFNAPEFQNGRRSTTFFMRYNHTFWTPRSELAEARSAVLDAGCQEAASRHAGMKSEMEKLENFLAPFVERHLRASTVRAE